MALSTLLATPARAAEAVTVMAAASLGPALEAVVTAYRTSDGGTVRTAFASSGALARQIERGAPADIFIAADPAWMDYLEQRGRLAAGSRRVLLGNRLVLVAPHDSAVTLRIAPGFPLAAALGAGRLALGDPAHAPVGTYARSALERLGVWSSVANRVAHSQDARATLALVTRGAAPLAIVYATDAALSDRVRIVDRFPPASHPPIVYPMALIAGRDGSAARRFFAYLDGPAASAIFERFGFAVN